MGWLKSPNWRGFGPLFSLGAVGGVGAGRGVGAGWRLCEISDGDAGHRHRASVSSWGAWDRPRCAGRT